MAGLVFHSLQDLPETVREQAAKKMLAAAKARPVAVEKATSKMHNVPTIVAGIRFDSRKEARRYEELMGSEPSAASGRRSEVSEWPRSAGNEPASPGEVTAGNRNRRASGSNAAKGGEPDPAFAWLVKQ